MNEAIYGELTPICKPLPYITKPIVTLDDIIQNRPYIRENVVPGVYITPPYIDPSKIPIAHFPEFSISIWGDELTSLVNYLLENDIYIPIPVIPPVQPFCEEHWVLISYKLNPMPVLRYAVSDQGRIYSYDKHKLINGAINQYGYIRTNIKLNEPTKNGKLYRKYYFHVPIVYSFSYFDGCESLQIDHIDGDKTNNNIHNLELVTPKENTNRAWKNGLASACSGEDHYHAMINNEQAEEIAKMISEGKSYNEIVSTIDNATIGMVKQIACGHSWHYLYEKYQLWLYRRHRVKLSDDLVEKICIFFQNNANKYLSRIELFRDTILNICGREYKKEEDYASLNSIYMRRHYNHISSKYIW